MPKKIVVTGLGATTPLGGTARDSWNALLAGESGASTIEKEWVSKYELPVTFAAQAKVPASEQASWEIPSIRQPSPTKTKVR